MEIKRIASYLLQSLVNFSSHYIFLTLKYEITLVKHSSHIPNYFFYKKEHLP